MRVRSWLIAAVVLVATVYTAYGQTPRAPAAAPTAGVPAGEVPLQCWWRASTGAIHVGEIVEVTLTCSALESDALRVLPDETRLTVAAVQMAPWEIVGGSHPADTRAGNRRLFQYGYQLRLLDANAIGRDVKLPPLAIPYRLQSRMGADTALAGRDLLHVMPQVPIRVVGQVPFEASDIRDGSAASLAEIGGLRFRASGFRTAGTVLAALAAVALLAALAPLAGRLRTTRVRTPGRASDRAVLGHAAARLDTLLTAAGAAGWSPETVGEAHAAARLVAGVMLGGGVRQRQLAQGEALPEGRLLVERWFGRVRGALTSSVTAGQIGHALDALPGARGATERARLQRLRDGLASLARAQYTQVAALDDTAPIDDAVRAVRDLGREEARARLWSWRYWRGAAPHPS
ncbi:MAG: hypothetical protein ABI880_06325 [Acidobacteriota bacterium]